jgi:hypothetical protein
MNCWLAVPVMAALMSGQSVRIPQVVSLAEADQRCWRKAEELFGVAQPVRPFARKRGRQKRPKVLREVMPVFPPELPEGSSFLGCSFLFNEVLVAPSGDVAAVWTVRRDAGSVGCPPYEEAVANAIVRWKYEPYRVDGKTVPFCISESRSVDLGEK